MQFLVKVICPLLSCLMLLVRQCRKLWIFRSSRSRYFYDPLYLAVTCSAFACGVQDYGLSWKMTSGRFLFSILLGSTVDMLRQFTEACWFLRLFPVVVQRRIPMVLLFVRSCGKQPSSHSCAFLHGHRRCTYPSLCNDRCYGRRRGAVHRWF